MFKNFRWRIAVWFVGLSAFCYVTITLFGVMFYYSSMNHRTDTRLGELAAELKKAIDLQGETPKFSNWFLSAQTAPGRTQASIELYDNKGRFLQACGPKGFQTLLIGRSVVSEQGRSLRLTVADLSRERKRIGYLQVGLPTTNNDSSTYDYGMTMALVAPLVLLGLGFSSYFVSGKAVEPIQENVKMLKGFLADAGHELNTPLTIIRARAEALQRKLEKQGLPTEDLRVINASAERMEKIVNDLTLLAEIERPLATSAKELVDVDAMVSDIVEQFSAPFTDKGIEISLSAGDSGAAPLKVYGYIDSLERMLSNLLENALKYTDVGGKVDVAVKSDGNNIRLAVTDTGIGIPPQSLPHIFERFYRVDTSRSRASGGSGLGLSITKAIVEVHAGEVLVASEEGKGTTVTIVLPGANGRVGV